MFIDCHTHIQFPVYDEDRKEVIQRALNASVGMINVGTQKDTSRKAVELAHEYENESIYATVGFHPCHVVPSDFHDAEELESDEAPDGAFDYEYYKKLALDPKVVAIGECGLDYFRIESEKLESVKKKQEEIFLQQIRLAHEVKKPLMIHCRSGIPERASPQNEAGRDAFSDLIDILISHRSLLTPHSGIIHFFTGTKEDAQRLLELGFSFTFGGAITYEYKEGKGVNYAELIRYIPLDKILSETDAPYVAPVPYRGKRNEPAYVIEVVKKIAEIKNIPLEQISQQILENTHIFLNRGSSKTEFY